VLDALTGSFPHDGSLFHAVFGDQMSLEDVCSMERFLRRFRTKFANNDALVVGEGVTIPVVPSRETFVVVFTGRNRAFLWTLGLVSEHMHPEVLQVLAAIC
jgi:hypothetical protein